MNKSHNALYKPALTVLIVLMGSFSSSDLYAVDNTLHQHPVTRENTGRAASPVDAVFHGELVEDPCIISPDSEVQEIDLQRRESSFFYNHASNPVTAPVPFTLKLKECDVSLGKYLKISLLGDEDTDMPGLLKISGSATGIAIGLDSTQGGVITAMPVNQQAKTYTLLPGENTLTFQAWVTGKKNDIANKTIGEGDYTAMVEFGLEYE